MTQPWPWPDDRPTRHTRIAYMYRDALADEAPDACAELDAAMVAFGQTWIAGGRLYTDTDDLLTVRELAEAADVTQAAVRQWVRRWPLRQMATNDAGHNLYRWGDVLAHLSETRNRKKKRGN